MRNKFLPLLTTLLLLINHARAQSSDPLRKDLVQTGDAFLTKEISAEEFIAKARTMKAQRTYNEDERSYLTDVSEKLPADLRHSVCPSMTEGLCLPDHESFAAETLAEAEHGQALDHDLPNVPLGSEYSRPLLWIVAAGLVFLAGNAALKGKELQIRSR